MSALSAIGFSATAPQVGGVSSVAPRAAGASDTPGGPVDGLKSPLTQQEDAVAFSQEALARQAQAGAGELTEEEQREVQRLQQRDREVRQHEAAHVAAAGRYARGGAQLQFSRGPDGRQYATGGEASIDVSPESTPEATIAKAQIVRRAALAPAEPSPQDRRVAAQASQLELKARQELAKQQTEEGTSSAEKESGTPPAEGSAKPQGLGAYADISRVAAAGTAGILDRRA